MPFRWRMTLLMRNYSLVLAQSRSWLLSICPVLAEELLFSSIFAIFYAKHRHHICSPLKRTSFPVVYQIQSTFGVGLKKHLDFTDWSREGFNYG